MSYKPHAIVVIAATIGLSAFRIPTASADMVLGYQETVNGRTGGGAATSYLALPTSDTYADTFHAPTAQIPGTPFGFYDDFLFTVTAATTDSVTSTIDFANVLAINNLSVRLYNTSGNPNLPVTGAPSGGAIDAWSNTFNLAPGTTETVDVLPKTQLSPGTYVLEIAGNVTGSAGGSYSGTINLTPVPLPAGLGLLVSGFGLLGALRRRCRFAGA